MLEALLPWDEHYLHLLNAVWTSPLLDRLLPWVSDARTYTLPFIVAALAILLIGRLRGLRFLILAVVGVVVADAIGAHLLKSVFWRTRPCVALEAVRLLVGCVNSPSFPSNHAINGGALATLVALHAPRLALPSAALALLVGYSRVYVGVHYPLDVIVGWVLGVIVASALAWAMTFVWPSDPGEHRHLFSLRFGER
jgi:undecaprenyl-diphosphatase